MRILTIILILVICIIIPPAQATSLGEILQSIYNRGLYFDADRFDTAVIRDFTNDAQTLIATIGNTNQAWQRIIPGTSYAYALDSDFYSIHVVVLNADPLGSPVDPGNVPSRLEYVPFDQLGTTYSPEQTRPSKYAIWQDSIRLDRKSPTGIDTVSVYYFALPTPVTDTGDTIDIPDAYIPLLKEIVVQMCLERITFPERSPREEALALTKLVQEALLGREADRP
jgi:hypothetical protein